MTTSGPYTVPLIAAFVAAVIALVFGALASLTDVHRLMDGRRARFGCVFYFGWLLIVAPVVLVLMSDFLVERSGATGELRASAPWLGFTLAFLTFIPSIVLMTIGTVLSLRKATAAKAENAHSISTTYSTPPTPPRLRSHPTEFEVQTSTVFELKQQGPSARAFDILRNDHPIGRLRQSRDKSVWRLDLSERLASYEFYRKSVKGKLLSDSEFLIESGGEVIAQAHRSTSEHYSLQFESGELILGLRNAGRRKNRWIFILETEGREVGRIQPISWLTLTCKVLMKDSLPDPIIVFVVWLAMERWRHGVARVKRT